ncbi:MAG: hypothetical protein A3H95_15280 [Acidobacteria bacterium RIFCSPLOWO2_02_FULL_64_15]|nr:MAG: hypothetical protein A3H95_15280 [Acidobacteria bacterium RIFCSPLOWO2_02_FULL_64_15]
MFGPFRVLHQVGAGALGPVFRAYDPDQDRLVAIKLFRLDLAPDRVHRLVAEFETIVAARLAHPAIAQPIVAGIEGVEAYLAQEYVSAESLDTVVREQGSVRYTDAVRIGAQLADALDVAAASGLLHGALHPRDVLLSPDQARLTGLGVVAALEAVGAVAPIRRPYTAPERVAGAAWNRSADVFGLAALMHELLWGRRVAAMGREAARSLTEIADGDLQHLQTVFARALAENPDERFATATQFADALANGFSRRSSVASQQWAVGSSEPMVASHQAPAASHQVLEPRLPLEDEVVVSSPAFELEPPIEAVVDRFTDVDGTPESPISSRQSAVGSQQPAVGSLESIETSYQEPATGLRSSSFGQARRSAEGAEAASHESRSPLWPVVLALVAGAVLGSAVGYGVGTRMLPSPPASTALAQSAVASPVSAPPPVASAIAPGEVRLKPDTMKSATDIRLEPDPPKAVATAAATTPSAAQTGRLVVRSSPAGARVFVDGKDVGQTPVTIRDLARGSHRVRLSRDGYTTTERRVSITSDQLSRSMTVRLERPRTGRSAR